MSRPIASGQVSVRNAVLFAGFQLMIGLGVLVQFNWNTILSGVFALGLVGLYPLMKRWGPIPSCRSSKKYSLADLAENILEAFEELVQSSEWVCSSNPMTIQSAILIIIQKPKPHIP
jgi:4-hydroxybenzoate polyprenyltransferase